MNHTLTWEREAEEEGTRRNDDDDKVKCSISGNMGRRGRDGGGERESGARPSDLQHRLPHIRYTCLISIIPAAHLIRRSLNRSVHASIPLGRPSTMLGKAYGLLN